MVCTDWIGIVVVGFGNVNMDISIEVACRGNFAGVSGGRGGRRGTCEARDAVDADIELLLDCYLNFLDFRRPIPLP